MGKLREFDPDVWNAIEGENTRQQETIDLIAAENVSSVAVREAQGSSMTNKYAEGYAGRRWYAGCENIDSVERLAIDRAKEIFGAEYVNVQTHSGSQANMAVLFATLNPGDKILGMNLSHGGHLTHGFAKNFSGKTYDVIHYGVKEDTGLIDYDELQKIAQRERPAMIIAGASAYSRILDFKRFKEIADEVDALFMADMAHISGLVAAGVHPSPIPYADVVTSTTHKTLRGPRGGLILCKEKYGKKIDQLVFPGIQGGPLMHVIAAKAVAFKEALTDEFKECQKQTVLNARKMAKTLQDNGYTIVSGGTDNHLFLVDLRNRNQAGMPAQRLLERAGIVLNRNVIPFDTKSAMEPSGIRIGTPTVSSRGMKEADVQMIAEWIDIVLSSPNDDAVIEDIGKKVSALCAKFPISHLST